MLAAISVKPGVQLHKITGIAPGFAQFNIIGDGIFFKIEKEKLNRRGYIFRRCSGNKAQAVAVDSEFKNTKQLRRIAEMPLPNVFREHHGAGAVYFFAIEIAA